MLSTVAAAFPSVPCQATGRSNPGCRGDLLVLDREDEMKWRVLVELAGEGGGVELREVSVGECTTAACSPETLGLSPSVPCVDGPLDARGKMRGLTGGSIAIMCPAFSTRRHVRWPRWGPRSTPKQRCGFESRGTERVLWIVGSTDRHLIQLFHPGINARFRRTLADADKPPRASSWPMPSGHLVVQSRPKPRGGSIA